MASAKANGRRRPRRSGAVATSLGVHAVLLAVLLRAAPPPPEPAQPPDIALSIAPLPQSRIAAPRPAAPRPDAAASRLAAASRARSLPPARPAPKPAPLPTRPQGPAGPAAPPGRSGAPDAGTAGHPGPLPSAEAQGDVRGLLRATVGCEHREAVALTPAERERCDERLGALARAAPPVDLLPPDKRGAYGAAADAAARRRAMRDDPLYRPVVACQGPGSNLGLGCLPDDAIHHVGAH